MPSGSRVRHFISRTFAAFLFAAVCLAQLDTGAIVGIVHDASGAAIVKATITLTNAATGVVQTTTTNDSGQYQFSAVPPGTYSVKASAPGFGTQNQNDIEIHVQSRPSIDFTMAVGEVSTVLDVQATAQLLQTQTADVGGVVQERQIRDLPLNGRRYADLA